MNKHQIILPPADKAPLHTGNIFVWMWYFLNPYKRTIILSVMWRIIRETWITLLPIVIGFIIDAFETGKAQNNPEYYTSILIIYMIGFIISLLNIVFIPEATAVQKAMRAQTLFSINHLNKLSLMWHESQGSGSKLQRVMTGRRGYEEILRHIRWDIFPLFGNIIAVFVTFLITEMPTYYLGMYLGFIVTYIFISWLLARPYLRLYDKFNIKFEKLTSGVYEFVSSIRTVKAFHLSDYIDNKAKGLEEIGQKAIMNAYSINLLRWTVSNMVGCFWIFLFAWFGFQNTLNGTMSAGLYASTFFLATWVWHSCEVIGAILEKAYEHGNGVSRLVETLRVTPKKLDLEPAQNMPTDWKTISLENLSFSYDENESQGIHGISFTVNRGEKIAFVGNSGAGKSTLVKLLMKQMLPDSGEFKINTTSVSHISTENWLNQIGFVPQDVELFNLSIRENILIDRDNIDPDLFKKVLKQAALDEFIESLPDGIETVIGERGIKLSGGQRQRLGIARALIRQSPIMIFDEATSSLDSISESKIQSAIENSFEGRTVFVIAHRLSTIRNVDRILVLDDGCIIEDGNFNDLIKQNGHFAKLWTLQSERKTATEAL
jgi:ATP-binding cassette subfamily B protein